MKEEIKEKLRIALVEPIEKECQVLYILAETRKLLDRFDKTKIQFPVLRFYGNWVLHSEIERTEAIGDVLDGLEETIKNKNYDVTKILSFIDFESLREEIKSFFEEFNLPCDLFVSGEKWEGFRRLFVDILTDCPLTPKRGGIEYFSFKKPNIYDTEINYEIKFRDEKEPLRGGFSFLKPNNLSFEGRGGKGVKGFLIYKNN